MSKSEVTFQGSMLLRSLDSSSLSFGRSTLSSVLWTLQYTSHKYPIPPTSLPRVDFSYFYQNKMSLLEQGQVALLLTLWKHHVYPIWVSSPHPPSPTTATWRYLGGFCRQSECMSQLSHPEFRKLQVFIIESKQNCLSSGEWHYLPRLFTV